MASFSMSFAPKSLADTGSSGSGGPSGGKGSGDSGSLLRVAEAAAAAQASGIGAGRGGRGRGGRGGGGGQAKQGKGRGKSTGGACPACGLPKKPNSGYCVEHKKGYDTIYRYSQTEEASSDQEDQEAEWDIESESYIGSSRYIWITVFGSEHETKAGPSRFRDLTKSMEIICDFVHQNPGGTEKRKVRKFAVNLGKFYHRKGVRQEQMHASQLWKVDFELFHHEMKNKRGWPFDKSKNYWNEFDVDPTTEDQRDNLGPSHSRKRLWFPSSLMGGDKVESKQGEFEEKALDRTSKEAKYSEQELKEVEGELARGFKRPFDATEAVNNMHRTLMADAVTATGDKEKLAGLSSSSALKNAFAGAPGTPAPAPGTPAPAPATPGGKGTAQKPVGSPPDVRITRGESARTFRLAFDKKVTSVDYQLE